MVPVANRPLLEHVVEAVAAAGVDELVLVVGYNRDRIQTHFGDGDDFGVDIEYAIQNHQLGTGHAVAQATGAVDEEFLVLNGDRLIEPGIVDAVLEADPDAAATVAVTRVDDPSRYGVVTASGDELVDIDEKPVGEPESEVINAGVYRFDRRVFDAIEVTDPNPAGEIELTTALLKLAEDARVSVAPYRGRWRDVSQLWDLLTVNDEVVGTDGGIESDRIHPSAVVDDRCAVAPDSRIGPNAVVGGGSAVGRNVTIGANAVVSNAVVFPDASVDDGAVVRDCVVAANATVGPNATVEGGAATVVVEGVVYEDVVLGAVLGDNARLGGGATLDPGTVVGDDALIGSGARVSGWIDPGTAVRRG